MNDESNSISDEGILFEADDQDAVMLLPLPAGPGAISTVIIYADMSYGLV